MKSMVLIAALSLLIPLSAWAHSDPLPPLTGEDVFGTWEAVETKSGKLRIYRMEIRREGTSRLGLALYGGVGYVSNLMDVAVQRGTVSITFRSDVLGEIRIRGRAWKVNDGFVDDSTDCGKRLLTGLMEVKLGWGVDDTHPSKLTFVRYAGSSLTEELSSIGATAAEVIQTGTSTP